MKPLKKARKVAESALVCVAFALLPLLPRRLVVRLAERLGGLAFRLSRNLRRIALVNLDTAYRDTISAAEKERIAERSFVNCALTLIDIFWFSLFARKRIAENVAFDPSFDCYFKTSPLIAVTGHLGNWEVMGQAAAMRGAPPVSVAAPLENSFADFVLNRLRRRNGQEIVFKQGAVQGLLKALHNNGRIALLMDQNTLPEEGGEFVKLFGLPVPISKAASTLSARSEAGIIMAHCVADKRGKYTAYAFPIEKVEGKGNVQAIATAFEGIIRAHPEHWLWMYKRWKHVPSETPMEGYPFYARKVEAAGGGAQNSNRREA